LAGALGDERHVLALFLHFLDVRGQDGQGLAVERSLFELEEGGLEEVHVRVNFLLLALVEALALFSGFGGETGFLADELGHFEEIATWFPIFPADFGVGELGGVMEGKEEESLLVALGEPALRVVDLLLPLLALLGDGFDRTRPGGGLLLLDSL
jgi:hypothetical protein